MSKYRYGFNRSPSASQFRMASNDCDKLQRALPHIRISGWDRMGGPTFNEMKVCFNGFNTDGWGTFMLTQHKSHDECETKNLPYDFLVCCCLVAFSHHCPHFVVASQDGFNSEKWNRVRAFCEETLGYGKSFEIRGS